LDGRSLKNRVMNYEFEKAVDSLLMEHQTAAPKTTETATQETKEPGQIALFFDKHKTTIIVVLALLLIYFIWSKWRK